MAFMFNNKTTNHKFIGSFNYNELTYKYILYLPDLNDDEKNEVIQKFGTRKQNGKNCLDVDEATVQTYINNRDISAYIIVNELGSDETASGTLQIYDWCSGNRQKLIQNRYVWINDVCRILGNSLIKSQKSPVGALFYFMEQLTVQNMGKKDIYLFVDASDETNKTVLTNIYSKNYGFTLNSLDNPSICPKNNIEYEIVMRKSNLMADPTNLDLSFLTRKSFRGGKSKKNKSRKNKSGKNKSRKNKSRKNKSRKNKKQKK